MVVTGAVNVFILISGVNRIKYCWGLHVRFQGIVDVLEVSVNKECLL